MPSHALAVWRGESAEKLDELIAAHTLVGGTKPGRRYATDQLNASLVLQIAAHFQLFCRDLHTEATNALAFAAPERYRQVLRIALTSRRQLDRGNARQETIHEGFGRFDLDIWERSVAFSRRVPLQRDRLGQLNTWRNPIAHQDFTFSGEQRRLLAGTSPTLRHVKSWRSACDGLAGTFDRVLTAHLQSLMGTAPW
jgi:hypothetical protein